MSDRDFVKFLSIAAITAILLGGVLGVWSFDILEHVAFIQMEE